MSRLDFRRRSTLWIVLLISTTVLQLYTQSAANAATSESLDTTDAYRLALMKIKGHLNVARALIRMRAEGAEYHFQQLPNIFGNIKAEAERRSAPFTASTLTELKHAMDGTPVTTLATINLAALATDGSFAQTGAVGTQSVLAVSEALLREAVDKYMEAVVDNEVIDIHTYQTGRGFATEAEALIRHSIGLKRSPGFDSLLDAVVLIRQAWPGVLPPPIVFDPPSVVGWFDQAVEAMHELR